MENTKEVKKMADYSMTDPKWAKNELKVRTYLANPENDEHVGGMAAVIEWNLEQGQNDPENRKRFWTNITNLFAMLPNNPIGRGRESDLPEAVQQSITQIAAQYANAYSAVFATDPLFGEIVRKHGKSGGGVYADSDEYAEALESSMKSRLTTYYRNSLKIASGEKEAGSAVSWNGDMNGHVPVIIGKVVAEDDSSEEEE
jgi:hypothetical protein